MVRTSLVVASLVATTSLAHALPDKQTDREGWIKASMQGRQAVFCSVPANKLSGAADPDFMTNQMVKMWDAIPADKLDVYDVMALANAICKFPGNPDLQAALMPRFQAFAKQYGLDAADLADIAAIQDPATPRIERPMRGPKDTRLADVDPRTQALVAKDNQVTDYGMGFMSYAEMLDATPNASEHMKVAFVASCVEGYDASIARWAICKADARALDRKRYDKELAAAKIDPTTRLGAKLEFVRLQGKVAAFAAKLEAEAKKDDGVAKVIDTIPAAAAAAWATESKPHQALLAWAYKIVDDARANSKKLMDGCEDQLQTHLATYLKARKPATPDDLKNALHDNIGSQLASAAARCFVRSPSTDKWWSEMATGYAARVGVRTAIWHALAAAKIEFDTDRGNDPLGLPRPVILYANAGAYGSSSGTIATMKETGDGVAITFKKESWKEPVCNAWKETDRIDGIDPRSGKLIYRSVCTKPGYATRTSTAEPVTVPARYAAGLKVGVAATFTRNDDGSAYPTAVYTNASRTKLAGAFGVQF